MSYYSSQYHATNYHASDYYASAIVDVLVELGIVTELTYDLMRDTIREALL